MDGSEPHAVTLRGLCAPDTCSISCSEGHKSSEVLTAILDQLEEQERKRIRPGRRWPPGPMEVDQLKEPISLLL